MSNKGIAMLLVPSLALAFFGIGENIFPNNCMQPQMVYLQVLQLSHHVSNQMSSGLVGRILERALKRRQLRTGPIDDLRSS
jgi:hypothetical protein